MEGDFLNLQFFFFAKKYLLPPEGALDMSVFCLYLRVICEFQLVFRECVKCVSVMLGSGTGTVK